MDSKKDEKKSEASSLDGILLRVDAIEEAVEVNCANTEDFMRRISDLLIEHMSKMEERYNSSFVTVSADITRANNNTARVEMLWHVAIPHIEYSFDCYSTLCNTL